MAQNDPFTAGAVPAALPANETERLAAVRSYGILDSLPEEVYDDLVFLASTICQTPIALVSIVDEKRQFLKANIGLAVKETPRELAFCAHAILEPVPLVVEDATTDPRFATNPLVTGHPDIRFYVGVPLVNPEGFPLGTLCAIDTKPRQLTPDQQRGLAALSRQVMVQLELRRAILVLEGSLAASGGSDATPLSTMTPPPKSVDARAAAERARVLLRQSPGGPMEDRVRGLLARLETLQASAPKR